MKNLVKIFSKRKVNEAKLAEALKMGWDTPAVQGLITLIDEALENAANQAGAPELADKPGALAHTAGGMEWLRYLRSDIERFNPNRRANQ